MRAECHLKNDMDNKDDKGLTAKFIMYKELDQGLTVNGGLKTSKKLQSDDVTLYVGVQK
jgi:hypothetical protein